MPSPFDEWVWFGLRAGFMIVEKKKKKDLLKYLDENLPKVYISTKESLSIMKSAMFLVLYIFLFSPSEIRKTYYELE